MFDFTIEGVFFVDYLIRDVLHVYLVLLVLPDIALGDLQLLPQHSELFLMTDVRHCWQFPLIG
jgi:hypothetical protein